MWINYMICKDICVYMWGFKTLACLCVIFNGNNYVLHESTNNILEKNNKIN